MTTNLADLLLPKTLTERERNTVFQYFFRRLVAYRNTTELYAEREYRLSALEDDRKIRRREEFNRELRSWAQTLLEKAWIACQEPGGGNCPKLESFTDRFARDIPKHLPQEDISRIFNAILFLHITSSNQYSSRTRSFLSSFGPIDEKAIVSTLRNPDQAIKEIQRQAKETQESHAEKRKTLRTLGVGLGAIAGGVLIGVTGGLAAPFIGASVTTVLGWLGVGGTAAGLLASGLAGSSVVCGALFGAYGARSTADMVERHTREIRDLAIVPMKEAKGEETLAVRLCVSGWLSSSEDVTAPWTVFGGDETFALQWEVEALKELSGALSALMKNGAMQYAKMKIMESIILGSLMNCLAPVALLQVGQIIDNPWMNAKALAIKAGAVLGELLSKRVFGNRPVTLAGYSLGSLVIFEALKYLASISSSETVHLIQDVFLFGTPAPIDAPTWAAIRRLVSGRLVNGYSKDDYVLAVISRVSDASWGVAGLQEVDVEGVENVLCEGVDGHTKWREVIGRCLQNCGAAGIIDEEVEGQIWVKGPECLNTSASTDEMDGCSINA